MSSPVANVETDKCMQDVFTKKKTSSKIDIIGRLQVISALDNGQSKVDVAREYGVHPQTIAYIYKQKELLLKKYKQKLDSIRGFQSLDLSLLLIDWFRSQVKLGIVVYEENLREKAKEMIASSNQEFDALDDWLLDFRRKHNILKYDYSDTKASSSDEWSKLLEAYCSDDLYVAGSCALYHRLNIHKYLDGGSKNEGYVSIFMIANSSGTDKKKLLVASDETSPELSLVKSLPIEYCFENSRNITLHSIVTYLEDWDRTLGSSKRNVALVLDVPKQFLDQMHFDNIRVIHHTKIEFLRKFLEKIIVNFKHNYRKQQIVNSCTHPLKSENTIMECLDMITLSWHSVSPVYICRLFHPPPEASLHWNDCENDGQDDGHRSLSTWRKTCDLPLEPHDYSIYDEFMLCDTHLQSIDNHSENTLSVKHELLQEQNCIPSTSSIEAYQAMKRLITYVQGHEARGSTLESARALENHLEYQAMVEIREIVSENSTNNIQ